MYQDNGWRSWLVSPVWRPRRENSWFLCGDPDPTRVAGQYLPQSSCCPGLSMFDRPHYVFFIFEIFLLNVDMQTSQIPSDHITEYSPAQSWSCWRLPELSFFFCTCLKTVAIFIISFWSVQRMKCVETSGCFVQMDIWVYFPYSVFHNKFRVVS